MKEQQGEACCTLDHVCRRGCVPPTSSSLPADRIAGGTLNDSPEDRIRSHPGPSRHKSGRCRMYTLFGFRV